MTCRHPIFSSRRRDLERWLLSFNSDVAWWGGWRAVVAAERRRRPPVSV